MNIIEIFLISISLAMDAFAVSICKGLQTKKNKVKKGIIIGLFFGVFQGLMPILGFYLGKIFNEKIMIVDHWVAFGLLLTIGIGMINESFDKNESKPSKFDLITLLLLSIATSIDAFATGITFAFLKVNIMLPVIMIAIVTFTMSFVGYIFGQKLGKKIGNKSELIGGIVLILLGIKIVLEHLNII